MEMVQKVVSRHRGIIPTLLSTRGGAARTEVGHMPSNDGVAGIQMAKLDNFAPPS
jgi:hypothetical protein